MIVVVGGGVAGLAAASYLARAGRSVTVLERAADLGGRARTDQLAGYALNRGIHALYTGGAASEVLRDLGVSYRYGVPKHVIALDERGTHPFPDSPLAVMRTSLLDAGDKRELGGMFLRLGQLRAPAYGHHSVVEWVETVARRPRVRQLLLAIARVYVYSTALDLVSADVFISKLQQTVKNPIHYIDGGWQTLVDSLRDAALSAGVTVRTSERVSAVELAEGRAIGVRLRDGEEVPADQVVLALPPDDVLDLLPVLRPTLAEHVPAYVACLDVALSHLPAPTRPVVFDLDQPRFMTAQSAFARVAPGDGAVIHVFKQEITNPQRDRADLEDLLDQVQAGWREVVVQQRFLPRMLASGLLPLASQGGLAARPAVQSEGVPSVYLAGDWVGPRGFLIDASLNSARDAAQCILDTAVRRAA